MSDIDCPDLKSANEAMYGEIKELRAEVERLKEEIAWLRDPVNCEKGSGTRAEIERLAKERDEAWEARDEYIRTNVTLRAEIERLHNAAHSCAAVIGGLEAEIKRLNAEKLELANHVDGCVRVAAEALAEVDRLKLEAK
jgi:uncharacterized coiled-coil DUF342 family protein